ncbi:MAG TPA: cell division protein ZapA [Allosphingosinicella sp.]|jgi:cell division protein ZapA
MASVDVEVGGRRYSVACRAGEEGKLRSVAAIVDEKARDAAAALGNLSEARHLLYASLLLADEVKEGRASHATPTVAEPDPALAAALERLAERVESLAERLEQGGSSS